MAPKFEQTKQGRKYKSPCQAIKAKCFDCCAGGARKVDACTIKDCELFAYRSGKNPFSARRQMSEEQRQAASERFKKLHEEGKIGRGKKKPATKPATKKKVIKKIVKVKRK